MVSDMSKMKMMAEVAMKDLAMGKDLINRTIRYTIYLSVVLSPILFILEVILSIQQKEFLRTNIYAAIYMIVIGYLFVFMRFYKHKHVVEKSRYKPVTKELDTIK